jgi:hypothetical protein
MATEATDKSLEAAAKKDTAEETANAIKAFKTKTGPKFEAAGTALKETAPTALSLAAGHLVGLPYKRFKKDMQKSALQRLRVGDYSRRAAALAKQAAAPVYEMRAQDRRAEQEGAQPARMFAQATGDRAPAFDDSQQKVMGQILEQQLAQAGKDRELDLKTVEGALDDAAEKGMITADFVQKLLGRYKAARKEQIEEGFGLQKRTADQEEDEPAAAATTDEKKKQAAEVA